MSIIPEVNRAMTLKESSKIGSFFCVIFATDTILFLTSISKFCGVVMSNIIRLNETAPNNGWIVMSNQGMDCFLDLLITAADVFEKTEHQKKLISFLKDQKGISCIRMGTINRKRLY